MDFIAEKGASEREALKSTIRALTSRLSQKEAEVISLQAQLSLLSPSLQSHISLLDQDLQSLLSAVASHGQTHQKAALLERKNRELQERCDEYYEELVELRRMCRRIGEKSEQVTVKVGSLSAQKESSRSKHSLCLSQVTERREHNRMMSSYL